MTKRVLIFFIMSCLTAVVALAQKATVESMKETTDIIAGDDRRLDYNKQPCALVKVQVVDDITDVEGNVMGDIVSHGVEKWVYMAQGSRNMKIHLRNSLPVNVMFRDYKINGLKGNRVYELTIRTPQSPTPPVPAGGSNALQMSITPATATVYIWGDQMARRAYTPEKDGSIITVLPYGRYQYEVKAKDYNTQEGSIFVSDAVEWTEVSLTPIMGTLSINCPTEKATFYANGKVVKEENKEKSWMGDMEPGEYSIIAKRKGYISQTRQVKITANRHITVNFNELVSEEEIKEKEEIIKHEEELRIKRQKQIEERQKREKEKEELDSIRQQKRQAQIMRIAEKDKRSIVFGLTTGLNLATAQFGSKFKGDAGNITAFHLGLTTECRLSNKFYLNTGLLYSGKGYTYKNTSNDIDEEGKAQYIDIPLMASLRLPLGKTVKLQLNAGPYAAFCIGGNVEDLWEKKKGGSKNNKESFSSAYSGFDYGLQIGIGFDIYYHFHIGANYQLGTSSDYANRNLMLGLGYRF